VNEPLKLPQARMYLQSAQWGFDELLTKQLNGYAYRFYLIGILASTPFRRIPRSIYEEARDVARALAKTEAFEQSRRERKRIEMLFAHLKRILRLGRLRLRGPCGAQFEFTLAAIAQNLRRLVKLVARPPPIMPTTAVA
jgi:hypothetical protein